METIANILPYIQIALSVLLIGAILLQQTGSSLGGAFGGDNFAAGFHTRRGAEKILFNATIVFAILFVVTAFLALLIKNDETQPIIEIDNTSEHVDSEEHSDSEEHTILEENGASEENTDSE